MGGDRNFSKMAELLGPQNRKMVELIRDKFAPNIYYHFAAINLYSTSEIQKPLEHNGAAGEQSLLF